MSDNAIDFDHLDRYVAGDSALRDEVLTIFEGQVARCLRLLDPAGPNEQWRSVAHALKGASRGIGAWDVGTACEEAENLLGNPDQILETRRAMKAEIERTVNEAMSTIRAFRRDQN